jgi:FkbM family methyltransferase
LISSVNARLKKLAPKVQGMLKRAVLDAGIPFPKPVFGKLLWIHPRLLNKRITEPHVIRWLMKYLRPGDVCFDVGGHEGWMGMLAAKQVGPRGRVVVFEPSPPLVEMLAYHKRVNRMPQMKVIGKAVSHAEASQVPFHLIADGYSSMNSLLESDVPEIQSRRTSTVDVDVTTLDEFSSQSGLVPQVLKIDTEGSELSICYGARELLDRHRPVLIIATHPPWLPEGQRIEDLFDLLSGLGYRIVDSVVQVYEGADFGDYLCIAGPENRA